MSQKPFHLSPIFAALLQSRNAFLLRCLVALLVVSLNIHSGIAFAKDAPSSNLTGTQKLQASFDALAKKEAPEKDDWKSLSEVCSALFEVRDFSRIFTCVDITERWRAKVGEQPYKTTLFGTKVPPYIESLVGYPTLASVMLIEARAHLEAGNYAKAIELAKRALEENKRVYISVLEIKDFRSYPWWNTNNVEFLREANLLLVTALFIEGKRDESAQFQKIVEEFANPLLNNRKEKAKSLAFRVRLFLAAEQYEDAIKLIEQDTQGAYLAGDAKKAAGSVVFSLVRAVIDPGGGFS